MNPIATLHSPYREKFGIPRQSGLAPVRSTVKFLPKYRAALEGIEGFSHIWILFLFHSAVGEKQGQTVRPPRLGGKKRIGKLATRSPHRPNPIGISAVKLIEARLAARGGPELVVEGADLLDGTPVLDIKPYIAYSDAIPDADSSWAQEPPQPKLKVTFDPKVDEILRTDPDLKKALTRILELDPRPQGRSKKTFAFHFGRYDVHWQLDGSTCNVTELRNKK